MRIQISLLLCATKRLEGKTASDAWNLIQKTNISTNFDYKKNAKNSQFAMKCLTVYSFVIFLYKKRLFPNINRVVEFPKVNKRIMKQNKVWKQTIDQFKRQNVTLPLQWRTKFWMTIHILPTSIKCLLVSLMLSLVLALVLIKPFHLSLR